jgi:hypothetical protein
MLFELGLNKSKEYDNCDKKWGGVSGEEGVYWGSIDIDRLFVS